MGRSRALSAVLGLSLLVGACKSGDLARNGTQNLFGGAGGRLGDVAGATVQSALDFQQQQAVQFSPEQEYYLGRGVAANAIATYGLDPDEARQAYVRKVGAALVANAPRIRSTYGGYHFAVLASPTPNGISGPGGHVMITRGALDLARNEDEVAGVLAHEIAHVSLKHGEAVIRKGGNFQTQMAGVGRILGAASGVSAQDQNRLTQVFGETVKGFARDLASTGYGSDLEFKADREGTYILWAAGYDGSSIKNYLEILPDRPHPGWAAHPADSERIQQLAPVVAQYGGPYDGGLGFQARRARFGTDLPGAMTK